MDITKTYYLILLATQIPPLRTFLRDRYFPTNDATDIFTTSDVLAEYMDGDKKLAPFVAPRKGAVTLLRLGSYLKQYTPPNIAPRRVLTLDELKKRGFGEALFSKVTPEQRQALIIAGDIDYLGKTISRREELMAAEIMLNNGCVMLHIADDVQKGDELEIRFYDGDSNPAIYTPAIDWDQPASNKLADMAAMAFMLTSRGLPATDLLVAPDVADSIINDEKIAKQLDNQNINIGGIDPSELPAGATKVARLKTRNGKMIDILCYEETYTAEDGTEKPYIPAGHVVMTAPAAGRTLYGAVSQVEQSDGEVHTYAARRVPKYLSNADANIRSVTLTSNPLLVPNNKNPFISAKVQ